MLNLTKPTSYLGSSIHTTEVARANDASRFFRVASNLGLARPNTLSKFSRYIRNGFLSVSDAEGIILNRLESEKMRKYQLAKYWISEGFLPEDWFNFNCLALWPELEKEKAPANITLFP